MTPRLSASPYSSTCTKCHEEQCQISLIFRDHLLSLHTLAPRDAVKLHLLLEVGVLAGAVRDVRVLADCFH